MKIEVIFVNGPLHRIKCDATRVPPVNLFFDDRNRVVHAYVRDGVVYFYDKDLSAKLTGKWDDIRWRLEDDKNDNPLEPTGEVGDEE
jgi:hypothetical protein